MGERLRGRRRVLIEDARRNGQHLRITWHAEARQFVFSTWRDDVCTGASRVAVEDVAVLTGLLVDGLADSATAGPAPSGPTPSDRELGLGDLARAWWRTLQRRASEPSSATSRRLLQAWRRSAVLIGQGPAVRPERIPQLRWVEDLDSDAEAGQVPGHPPDV